MNGQSKKLKNPWDDILEPVDEIEYIPNDTSKEIPSDTSKEIRVSNTKRVNTKRVKNPWDNIIQPIPQDAVFIKPEPVESMVTTPIKSDTVKTKMKQKTSEPSWGSVIGKSLLSGMSELNKQLFNIPRMIYNGASMLFDLITPDTIYDPKKDVIKRSLDKAVEFYEKEAERFYSEVGDVKGAKKFVQVGVQALPQIVAAGFLAFGTGGVGTTTRALTGALGPTQQATARLLTQGRLASKIGPELTRMIPFGTIAAAGYAREAEKEGANYLQQVLYGVAGGLVETATEAPVFEGWLNIIDKMGARSLVERGARNLITRYGKIGLEFLKNGVKEAIQEAAVDPITTLAKKGIFKPDIPLTGRGGVVDIEQMIESAYGGLAMSVILGALGLPVSATANVMVDRMIREKKQVTPKDILEVAKEMHKERTGQEPEVKEIDITKQTTTEPPAIQPISITQEEKAKPSSEITAELPTTTEKPSTEKTVIENIEVSAPITKSKQEEEPSVPKTPSKINLGKTTTVKTERGTTVETQYAVIDADDLISSHDEDLRANPNYPQELQPRDRTRAASELQITRIANNIEPEFLAESPKASEGAPIVGPDMIVESGNARVIALKRAYNLNNESIKRYKQWLIDNSERFGINKDVIAKIEKPVLVRIRQTDVDRIKFTQEANEQSVAALSATEQAVIDAQKMSEGLLELFVPSENGEILTPENREFIRAFMQEVIAPSERGRYITQDGSISQEGIARIRNAVFAKAYSDIAAITKLAESPDDNVRNITKAMLIVAPKFAILKEGISKRQYYDLDISSDIAKAANKLSQLRESGMSVDLYLRQIGFLEDELSDIAKDILDIFDRNKRSVKKLVEIFNNYVDAVIALGHPDQVGLFEGIKITKADVLEAALRKAGKEDGTAGQVTLFQDQSASGEIRRTEVGGIQEEAKSEEPTIAEKQEVEETATPSQEILITVSPEDIPLDVAKNAWRWISFEPDVRARQEQQDYVNYMKQVIDELIPLTKTEAQRQLLKSELERFKENYIKRYTAILEARSKTASSMVTGAAKFNVSKNQKAIERERKLVKEFLEWRDKAVKSIKDKLNKELYSGTTEENINIIAEEEYERLRAEMLKTIGTIKQIESGELPGYNIQLFRDSLKGKLERFAQKGNVELGIVQRILNELKEIQERELKTPVFSKSNSIWKLLEQQPEQAETAKKTGENIIKEYEGVRIVENLTDDRVRIIFESKPSANVLNELKQHGWKWSPKNKAWQRKLTDNAKVNAEYILDKYYQSQTEETVTTQRTREARLPLTGQTHIERKATTITESSESTTAPSLKEIAEFIAEKLQLPVRVGRYRGRALGIFKKDAEVIRTKMAYDVETIAHEVGHFLDKKFGLSRQIKNYPEIMKLSEGLAGDKTKEAFAEFVRLYLTERNEAQRISPEFYDKFEATISKDENVFTTLRQAQRMYEAYKAKPGHERFDDFISFEGEDGKERPFTLDRFYTAFVDDLHMLNKTVEKMLDGKEIPRSLHPYYRAVLHRGWAGKAQTFLFSHQFDFESLEKVGPSLNDILKPFKTEEELKDFVKYITAKRIVELDEKGIKQGISRTDSEDKINYLRQRYGDRINEFENAAQELYKYQDTILKALLKSEVISQELYDQLKATYAFYVPLYKVFDESYKKKSKAGGGYVDVGQPIREIGSSGRIIINPLESIIRNTYMFLNLAERNTVARLLVELGETLDASGKWVERIDTPLKPVTFSLDEVKKEIQHALNEGGLTGVELDLDKLATIFRPFPHPVQRENIAIVFRNGKPVMYQLDPELYMALKRLDTQSAHWLIRILSEPAKLLRAGATLSPDFPPKNIVRDQFSALIFSKYGYIPVADMIKGLAHVLKKDKVYQDFYASGAAHGALVSLDRDFIRNDIRRMIRERTRSGKVKGMLMNPIELLRYVSELSEEATRTAEMEKGLRIERKNVEKEIKDTEAKIKELQEKARMTKDEVEKEAIKKELTFLRRNLNYLTQFKEAEIKRRAALAVRDVTLDFSRGGYVSKELNKFIAFFNPGVQGLDKMQRAFREDPARFLFRVGLYVTLPSLICFLINKDNEYYEELPRWEKYIFWHLPIPGTNGKRFIRIPKPFELGILFGTLPQIFLEYVHKKDPKAFKDIEKTISQYIFLDLVPDKDFMGFPPGLIPTAFIPILEVYANKSTFTKAPIVPAREQDLEPSMQYGENTSEVAKLLGRILNASPRKIDHMIYGYTGGLGRRTTNLLDMILRKAGAGTEKVEPAPKDIFETLSKVPVIGAFISKYPTAGQSPTIQDFYDDLEKAERLYNTAKTYYTEHKKPMKISKEDYKIVSRLKEMRKLADILGEMRKAERDIRKSTTMTPEQKRQELDQLQMMQINLIREFYGKEKLKKG